MVRDLLSPAKFETLISQSDVAENWSGWLYYFGLFVDPLGQRWEDFIHNCNEVVMVQEGRLGMKVSGAVIEIVPCAEVFISKDRIHFVRNIHTGISKWLDGYD